MARDRISATKGAVLLALILAASGQNPGAAPPLQRQSRAEQSPAQQTNTTKAPATTGRASQLAQAFRGRGRDPRQAFNPIRRARRRLEKLGIITSGRQWRNFRKYARHDPIVAEFWARTLRGEI